MAHRTLTAHLAAVKGATVRAALGHRPVLAEHTRLNLETTRAIERHRGTYCRRCLRRVGD